MRRIYKIIGQDFNDTHNMGVMLRLKNLFSGEVLYRTPLDIFNDKTLLRKLRISDILRIGYMVGEYQMYLSYRFMTNNKQKLLQSL